MKHFYTTCASLLLVVLLMPDDTFAQKTLVLESVRHNTSQPLRDMTPPEATTSVTAPFAIPNKFMTFGSLKNFAPTEDRDVADPVRQTALGSGGANVRTNFDGADDTDNAAAFGFVVVPPDTEGDVGPRHYVQWINLVAEIFDKRGNTIMGPFPGNMFFQGLGGMCETNNNGDPIVLYDEGADRWLVSQFALDFVNLNDFSMCIGISATQDPTGSYHQYELSFGNILPDYPKLGIWGDSYTMTTRNFIGASGQFAVAMDRNAMLNGAPASVVVATIPTDFFLDGYLPFDADDDVSGPPLFGGVDRFNPVRSDDSRFFEIFAFDIDWGDPLSATFSQVADIPVPTFDFKARPYIFQPNGEPLADLDGFTMHRAQVRNFDTHKSLMASHTVEVGAGTAGVRWYEFRNYGVDWNLYQSGTYSPDNDDRWMGSIAMNGQGDIALGYSRTSSTLHPSIYVTGQTADHSGTGMMNVAETLVHLGTGSQNDSNFRWGDYSMMSVDPRDDHTFWYTTEYYEVTSAFNFKTRIASFDLTNGNAAQAEAARDNLALSQAQDELPDAFSLDQNYPNPFNPTTMINFAMPEAGHVTIRVYNMLGQEMATVVNEQRDAGTHTVPFNAAELSAGVYLYVMETGEFNATRRMTLLK